MRPLRLLSGLVFLVFAGTALAGLPTLTYEGREYVELDLLVVAGPASRPVAHLLHTAIYRLPPL